MTTIKAAGRLLNASLADRVLSYLLLPFGEEGRTSAGRVTASAGAITIPDTHIVGNLEHDRTSPLATSTVIEETPAGLTASFRVLPTTAGNDLLIEASEGVRTGISVEIDNPVIRDGVLLAGTLSGAGFVATPAFPSAQLVAADAGDLPDELYPDSDSTSESEETIVVDGVTYVRKTTSSYKTETTPKDGPVEDAEADDAPTEEPTVTASTRTAPAALLARKGARTPAQEGGRTIRDVARLLAGACANHDGSLLAALADDARTGGTLFAALTDIKYDGTGGVSNAMKQPDWIGRLWSGKTYERKIVPLFSAKDMTSLKIKGWQWDTKPVMGEWTGNKTAIPSGAVSTKEYETTGKRLAGGHDHARELRDFANPEYWEGYFEAMTESYARLSDAGVLLDVTTAATPVTSAAGPATAPEGLVKIVDGVLSFIDVASATFALVATDLWRDLLLTPQDKALEYLSSALGIEDGSLSGFRIQPASSLAAGSVLVGAREAATVYELPGVPLRVEGLDMVKGGIDTALFGYYGTVIHDKRALALVTGPTGG